MRLEYTINPRKIALLLSILALYFAAQSLVFEYLIENVLDYEAHSGLILLLDLFSVNIEDSIPTWYATLLLFGAAMLLAIITSMKVRVRDDYARHWAGLAVIFLYLSIDEGAAVHEVIADMLQTQLTLTGYLFFAWQVVAAPLVILFVVIYWRFLFSLPPRTRNLFIVAGVVYIGGALVVEGISANRWYLDGGQSFEYLAIATIEELSEMLGVVILNYALLAYLVQMQYTIEFAPPSNATETDNSIAELQQPETARMTGQQFRQWWRPRPVIIAVVVIAVVNVTLVSWAVTQSSAQTAAINKSIIDQLTTFDVQVTPLEGHFSVDNLPSRQAAAGLLAEFDDVMIVTWASTEASIALAAHEMPFDRNRLTQVLYQNGETQFVIFDTPAVRALVGNVQPVQAAP